MSETSQDRAAATPSRPAVGAQGRPAADYDYVPPPVAPTSAWGGWVTFAGITLALVGVVHIVAGTAALFEPDSYAVAPSGLVFQIDYATWGWIHLVLGVVLLLTGVGVLNRRSWARIVGVVACGLSALVNLGFASAAPVWALTVIALDVLFIYAIVVHGHEAR